MYCELVAVATKHILHITHVTALCECSIEYVLKSSFLIYPKREIYMLESLMTPSDLVYGNLR